MIQVNEIYFIIGPFRNHQFLNDKFHVKTPIMFTEMTVFFSIKMHVEIGSFSMQRHVHSGAQIP